MEASFNLAPGVTFDPVPHEYSYKGRRLSGVTGKIAKRLNIRMPEEFVGEARNEGVHVHKAIQDWLETGVIDSVHPGALWVKSVIEADWHKPCEQCFAEVLVSDFKLYASMVDIIGMLPDGELVLYDIKRSMAKRMYVTWQLSIYKYLIETYTGYRVDQVFCLAVRDKTKYPISILPERDVKELLYG